MAIRLRSDRDTVMECSDNLAFMRPLKSGSMQLIVTSPPYNIGKKVRIQITARNLCASPSTSDFGMCPPTSKRGSLCWQVGNHVQKGENIPLDLVLYPIFREHGLDSTTNSLALRTRSALYKAPFGSIRNNSLVH